MARLVCGRWSKWIVLALWLIILGVAGPLAGKLTGAQQNDNSAWLPGNAEATKVMELSGRFQPDDIAPAVIVYGRVTIREVCDRAKAAADDLQDGYLQVIRDVLPSVVQIQAAHDLGSGVVYDDQGHIVTNYHVVEDQLERGNASVRLSQENNVNYDAYVSRVDKGGDLALIIAPAVLPVLPRVDAMPRPGEPVLVIGSPLGLGGSVTSGAVSALRTIAGITYLQISAPINPGNSGGPIVNEAGQVIGIAVAKVVAEEVEGIGFAIPIADVCVKLQDCPV